MVKNFHAAGIEVILDVVYNHTAEGAADGPTYSFRGLDDRGYYKRANPVGDAYWDVTGCGNTVDSTSQGALRLVLDSLRYWVTEMHVDGFRFDLASALARTGHDIDMQCAFLTTIGQDPVLRHVKLIAEPWDASMDGYLVGSFPPPWVEWNDRYRDTVRDFWRHPGDVRQLASRLAGSSDLYADDGRSPYASVNFVTAHDGFTLRDLVSYDNKHNEANGEDNRDGTDNNRSRNHGVEGETDDPEIVALRRRQAANLMVTLCLSTGSRCSPRATSAGAPSAATTTPTAGQRDLLGRLAAGRRVARRLRLHQDRAPAAARAPGPAAAAPLRGDARRSTAVRRTSPGCTRRAARWPEQDWYDDALHVIGMFVSGDPLRSPGPHGEQQRDSSFLIWLNAGDDAVEVTLPENDWVQEGEVVLSTDDGPPQSGRPCDVAGDVLKFGAADRRGARGASGDRRRAHGKATTPSSAGEASRPLRGTIRTV